MSIPLLCLLLAHGVIVWAQIRLDNGRYGHVLTFYAMGFSGFYLFRAIVLSLNLDSPILSPHATSIPSHLLEQTLLVLLLWQVVLVAGVLTVGRHSVGGALLGEVPAAFTGRLLVPTLGFLAIATVAAVAIVAQQAGGLAGTIAASKVEKKLAGLFYLQYIPVTGMLIAAKAAVTSRGRAAATLWSLAAAFSFAVMAWGSRRVVVVLVALFLVHRMTAGNRGKLPARKVAIYSSIGVPIILAASVGLRVVRDNAIGGALAGQIEREPLIRQVSLAINASYFEAVVLAVRDFPAQFELWGVRPFTDGIAGVVPRSLWADKPKGIAIGAEFRQIYEPTTLNGWPLGGFGEWLLAFGFTGVLVGALVSGMAIALVGRGLRSKGSLPFAAALGLQVFEIGVNGQSVVRWVGWFLPTALLAISFRLACAEQERRLTWRSRTSASRLSRLQ